MKNILTSLFLVVFSLALHSQEKMKITLNNGKIKEGYYKVKMTTMQMPSQFRIVSRKTKEKYILKDIKKLYVFTKNDSILYEVIESRRNFGRGPIKKKLGQVIFKGDNISLFAVETLPAGGGGHGFKIKSTYNEFFARKKEDTIAHNIGFIQGAGPSGIKSRIKNFFYDCPELVDKVIQNEIPKNETVKIALFYEKNYKNN